MIKMVAKTSIVQTYNQIAQNLLKTLRLCNQPYMDMINYL